MSAQEIIIELNKKLEQLNLSPGCDLGDVGNEIGIAVGKFINNNKMGYELDSFVSGIKHGISLIDGTH